MDTRKAWQFDNMNEFEDERRRYSDVTEFTVTEDDLKLLRRAYVGWQMCETGAPEIDPKRPYGNSSVDLDVAEILGVPIPPDEDDAGEEDPAFTAAMLAAHRRTEVALQIALATGRFEAGNYRRSDRWDRRGWEPSPVAGEEGGESDGR